MEVTKERRPCVGAIRTQAGARSLAEMFCIKICLELAQGVLGTGGSGAVGLCGRRNRVPLANLVL